MADIPVITPSQNEETQDNFIQNYLKDLTNSFKVGIQDIGDKFINALDNVDEMNGQEINTNREFKNQFTSALKSITEGQTKREDKERFIPKENNLLREGGIEGAGYVYLGQKLDEQTDELGEEKKGGLFQRLGMGLGALGLGLTGIKGIAGKLFPTLARVAPLAALAGGLIWAVIDGISAMDFAKEWGVSKLSAFIGGFLGGKADGGIKNAFKNMGKWALIGAGVGSIVPVVGTLMGGLVGAAIGFILGWIGGERIAKATEAVKQFITEKWNQVKEWFQNVFPQFIDVVWATFDEIKQTLTDVWNSPMVQRIKDIIVDFGLSLWNAIKAPFIGAWEKIQESFQNIKDIFASEDTLFTKIGRVIGEIVLFVPRMLIGWFTGLFDGVKGFFTDLFVDKEDPITGETKKALIKRVGSLFKDIGIMLWEKIKTFFIELPDRLWAGIRNIGAFAKDTILPAMSDIFSGFGQSISDFIDENPIVQKAKEWILDPISNLFGNIGDAISTFFYGGGEAGYYPLGQRLKNKFINPIIKVFNTIQETITGVWESVTDWVQEKVVNPVKEFLSNIGGLMSNLGSYLIWKPGHLRSDTGFDEFSARMDALREAQEEGHLQGMRGGQLRRAAGDEGKFERALGGVDDSELRSELQKRVTDSVKDAIIKPNGQIIQTASDDTIIASKSPVYKAQEADTNIQYEIEQFNKEKSNEIIQQNNTIIQLLQQIAEKTLGNQQNNIMNNSTPNPFDPNSLMKSLKGAYSQ